MSKLIMLFACVALMVAMAYAAGGRDIKYSVWQTHPHGHHHGGGHSDIYRFQHYPHHHHHDDHHGHGHHYPAQHVVHGYEIHAHDH